MNNINTNTMNDSLVLSSSAFKNNERIPMKYTCDGENISLPFEISGVDPQAKSLTLIMDDPDAPKGIFDHWIVFNIPPAVKEIEEGKSPAGFQGINSVGKTNYIGPCPPSGVHHYTFKLYSVDTTISVDELPDKDALLNLLDGHILQYTEIIGLYARK